METLTIHEVLELLGKKSNQPWGVFSDMQAQGKLNGFPMPLKLKVDGKRVYNKIRVMEWMERDKKPMPNLVFDFLTGKYDPAHLQAKRKIFRRKEQKINKPKPETVKVAGEW